MDDEIFIELREIKDNQLIHYTLSSNDYIYEFDTILDNDLDKLTQSQFNIKI